MNTHTPTLLVSNVLPNRPGDADYDRFAMRLWDRIVDAAAPEWHIQREHAQFDGPEGILLRAQHADAIVIMGGEDLHPVAYRGAQGYTGEGRHWRRADLAQLELVRYAIRTGTPLLGICRGHQVVNVACGGDLVQHVEGHTNPELLKDHAFTPHEVHLRAASAISRIHGGVTEVEVSSAHHQVIGRLGEDLHVTATAPDGLIEAIEHDFAPLLGVQWHPEDPRRDIEELRGYLEHLRASVAPRRRVGTTLVA